MEIGVYKTTFTILIKEIYEFIDDFYFFVCRKVFSTIMGICAVICTALALWHPAANAFAMMFLVIPAFGLLYFELREYVQIDLSLLSNRH